jgi:hypothetical protein
MFMRVSKLNDSLGYRPPRPSGTPPTEGNFLEMLTNPLFNELAVPATGWPIQHSYEKLFVAEPATVLATCA